MKKTLCKVLLYAVHETVEEDGKMMDNYSIMNSWELSCFLDHEILEGNIIRKNMQDVWSKVGFDVRNYTFDIMIQILNNNVNYGGKEYCAKAFEQEIDEDDIIKDTNEEEK